MLILILLSSAPAVVSADTYVGGLLLTTAKSGTVNGGVYVDAVTPDWGSRDVQKTFASIPDVNNIQWARLYVAVYDGHMQNNYQGTTSVSFDGNGDGTHETALGTESLNVNFRYIINGGNDNSAFSGHGAAEPYKMVNDHTNRVTSDYLMWYDVTSLITSQTPKAHVVTTAIDGSFDGRIKLITLVVAYNDGDTDTIYYWVNQGHDTDTYYSPTDYIGSTDFDLFGLSGTVQSATLTVNHMASSDGLYKWCGEPIPSDPAGGTDPVGSSYQGAYFGYNIWDMTSRIGFDNSYDLSYNRSGVGTGEFSGQFFKIPLAVLTVKKQAPTVKPAANFSATPLSGETPAVIRFTDLSTGPPTSWKWEYRYRPSGGSWGIFTQFATTWNPSYSFSGVGDYIIRLTATNSLGSNSKTMGSTSVPYITVTPLVAAFSATPRSGTAPLAVTFTNQTAGSVTSCAWDFNNDGTTDLTTTTPTASYTYATAGTYSVKLTVTGLGGIDDEVKTGYITVTAAAPAAEFSATPRSGSPPLAVSFKDESTGEIGAWAWDFENDGTVDSTQQNPAYTYAASGIYDVNLTVTGSGGSDTEVRTGYITVATTAGPPYADFSANRTVVNKNSPIKFTDKSTGIVTTWAWDLNNDGVTDSTAQDTVYLYDREGTYSVNLAIAGPGGSDNEKKIDYIKVRGEPNCDLTISGAVSPLNLGSAVFAREPNTIRILNIRNNGPSASPATTIELTASDGSKARADVPALESGANTSISIIDTAVRPGAGSSIRYNATIDPDDEVAETDETNNFKLSTDKTVTYNGYKGKRYWDGGDITTAGTFDLKGGLIHSFGDSAYRSGSFGGSGWTSYTVTWTASDLPVPSNAAIKKAMLYVPYTWDNSNAADGITISFNGESKSRGGFYKDRSNFGAYADHEYGLQTYDVTSSFKKNSQNTAAFSRGSANAKLSMYGFTLAVVYEDSESSRKQIFLNEGFDLLGADETGYATTPEEATAYVPFTGMEIDTSKVSRADLITFVASGDGEGALLFNGAPVGSSVWDFGSVSGPQVAVASRDVKSSLLRSGNLAAIRSTQGETPAMEAIQQFLVVEYGTGVVNQTAMGMVANFSAEPLTGNAPLTVNFTDLSTGNPSGWSWDFDNNGIVDNTTRNPRYTYGIPGNYTVKLTVNNGTAIDSFSRNNYIVVKNASVTTPEPTPAPDSFMSAPTSDDNLKHIPVSTGSTSNVPTADPLQGSVTQQKQSDNILGDVALILGDFVKGLVQNVRALLGKVLVAGMMVKSL